jgi:two-component sensor histidine kinase/PAS domain-containing protein
MAGTSPAVTFLSAILGTLTAQTPYLGQNVAARKMRAGWPGSKAAATEGILMALPDESASAQTAQDISDLFDSPELTKAIETEEFKILLEHLPIAMVISKLIGGGHRIVFANQAYTDLTGQTFAAIRGRGWSILNAFIHEDDPQITMTQALTKWEDFLGTFKLEGPTPSLVEAYASIIEAEDGIESYRIVAIIDVTVRERSQREETARLLRDKDMLLKELQHRVKNNLQLITALIRMDARNQRKGNQVNLDRLAGRIESLQLLYQGLSADGLGKTVDLGHYLSQIGSAVMHTYAVDGIRLDLKVDHAPASINIAMPVGLLVNELLINAFKHAFTGRGTGTITIRCLHEDPTHYRIVVADDGVGLPEGATWPTPGKLGTLILQSLRENAQVDFKVESAPGSGTRVTIGFVHNTPVHKPN